MDDGGNIRFGLHNAAAINAVVKSHQFSNVAIDDADGGLSICVNVVKMLGK